MSVALAPSVPGARGSARLHGRGARGLLLFAIAYLPLEEFLLRWAPGGGTGYVVLRLALEAALYSAVLSLAAGRIVRGIALPRTPLDAPLAAFVGLALASLALSGGSTLAGLANLRVLLRYVALAYLVVLLELAPSERRRMLVWLLASVALQGALGLVQAAQGGAGDFWMPRETHVEAAGVERDFAVRTGGIEQGAVLGTTDHPVAFALLCLAGGTLAAALLLGGAAPAGGLALVVALAGAGMLLSYTRSTLLGFALTLTVLAWMQRRGAFVRRWLPRALVLAPLGVAALLVLLGRGGGVGFAREKETRVSPLESVGALFTSEYLQSARSSRLWVLQDVGAEVARSAGWLGLGPDAEHARTRLLAAGGAGLHRLIAYRAFEDVYWVALLAYYGFLGLGALLLVLWRVGRAARAARARAIDPWDRAAAEALLALLVALVPLSFLAPTLDFRTFAAPLWLLAGLVLAPPPGAAGART